MYGFGLEAEGEEARNVGTEGFAQLKTIVVVPTQDGQVVNACGVHETVVGANRGLLHDLRIVSA